MSVEIRVDTDGMFGYPAVAEITGSDSIALVDIADAKGAIPVITLRLDRDAWTELKAAIEEALG